MAKGQTAEQQQPTPAAAEPVRNEASERWRIEFTGAGGQTLAILNPEEKTFKTGSRGFYAGGKCEFHDRKFQVSCSIVEIGTKPGGKDAERPTMN